MSPQRKGRSRLRRRAGAILVEESDFAAALQRLVASEDASLFGIARHDDGAEIGEGTVDRGERADAEIEEEGGAENADGEEIKEEMGSEEAERIGIGEDHSEFAAEAIVIDENILVDGGGEERRGGEAEGIRGDGENSDPKREPEEEDDGGDGDEFEGEHRGPEADEAEEIGVEPKSDDGDEDEGNTDAAEAETEGEVGDGGGDDNEKEEILEDDLSGDIPGGAYPADDDLIEVAVGAGADEETEDA